MRERSDFIRQRPLLIVMLTYDDRTVGNAYEIFDKYKDSDAQYWGFKEEPLPVKEMKELYAYMKRCGKKTVLEVVAYTEEEGLKGAEMAVRSVIFLWELFIRIRFMSSAKKME